MDVRMRLADDPDIRSGRVLRPATIATLPESDVGFRDYVQFVLDRMGAPSPEGLALRLRRLYPHARVEAGGPRWVAHRDARMSSVVISPDGTAVYAAGTTGSAYETVALSAADGSERWERMWDPFDGNSADARAIGISPDGSKVFVTGLVALAVHGYVYGTVAYGTAAGTELWTATYGNSDIFLGSDARALAVSSDGSKVFVTGAAFVGFSADFEYDYGTVAYQT